MSLFICQFCGSERKNANAKSNHEVYCKKNPNRKIPKGSLGKRTKPRTKPHIVEHTTEKCSYGCEQTAKYKTNSGKLICDASPNKCPENKKKNSKGGKTAYASGKRLNPKEQYKNLPDETKEKMAWAKGLTKETDERVQRSAESLKKNLNSGVTTPTFLGKKHNTETKKKISLKRIQFLENNSKHCEWYEVGGKKVQGTIEKRIAEFLVMNKIPFERIRLNFQSHRTYTPDFYIPKFDLFIEAKGFLFEKDKEKMRLVLLENDIDLRLAFFKDIEMLTDEADLLKLPKVQSYLKYIDYSKFENHWVVDGN